MPTMRILSVSKDGEIYVDEIQEVYGFKEATAFLAHDLRRTATEEFRNTVMRIWAQCGMFGGFSIRNGNSSSWVTFEYSE